MRRSILLLLFFFAAASLGCGLMAACSGGSDAVAPPGATPEEGDGPDEDPGAVDAGRDAAKDAAKDGAAKDSGSKDAGIDAKDAAIDATPLTCVTATTPTACANGLATTFTAQTMPALTAGTSTRLRIDRGGFFHAGWSKSSTKSGISYLTNRGGSFTVEDVTKPLGLPNERFDFARLVVDDCGRPMILYRHQHLPAGTNRYVHRIHLATKVSGGWLDEQLDVPTSPTDATPATDVDAADLVLDGNGLPVVVLTRYSASQPVVLRRTATGWDRETVPIFMDGINLPQVAWSSTLGLVFAYANGAYKPAVAWKEGGTWTAYDVPGANAIDSFASGDEGAIAVAAASDGRVHLAWRSYVGSGRIMRYASIASASAWTTPTAVPLPQSNMPTAITVLVPPAGEPRITFDQFDGGVVNTYVSRMTSGVFAPAAKVAGQISSSGSTVDANGREYLLVGNYAQTARLYTQSCVP